MSLIVTIKVPEGMVMAADSRVSMQMQKEENQRVLRGISHYSDSFTKIFMTKNGAGISFCGEMAVEKGGVNLYIEEFLKAKISEDTPLTMVAPELVAFLETLPKIPDSIFHIAGYAGKNDGGEPRLWRVLAKRKVIEEVINKPVVWDGEGDILARLTAPVSAKTAQGEDRPLASYPMPLNVFTMQDAVDFADFAVKVTIDTMRFQLRPKTVGGAVDILALQPNGSFWVRKKTLGVKN